MSTENSIEHGELGGESMGKGPRFTQPPGEHGCISGVVYLGEMVMTEEGEEEEVLYPQLCRKCYPEQAS